LDEDLNISAGLVFTGKNTIKAVEKSSLLPEKKITETIRLELLSGMS
jgi:hypothetical protein